MANTYTKILLHLVFAVKGREALIPRHILLNVHNYMAGVLRKFGHSPIEIGGTPNHVHILLEYKPIQPIPDMVRDLKVATTKYVNERNVVPGRFCWQRGYGCFSYAPSQVDSVRRYISNQEEHHRTHSLRDELVMIYDRFEIPYEIDYIFEE